jgi:hypothetical protein
MERTEPKCLRRDTKDVRSLSWFTGLPLIRLRISDLIKTPKSFPIKSFSRKKCELPVAFASFFSVDPLIRPILAGRI